MNTTATTRDEAPVFLPAGAETLFAIHTRPTSEPVGVGIVLLHGGDNVNAALQRNRLNVRIARALASLGYDVLRLDYHGVGGSTGTLGEDYSVLTPFTKDVAGGLRWLEDAGLDRYVLIGQCFGARTALAAAAETENLAGVVLAAPPVADYAAGEEFTTRLARTMSTGSIVKKGFSLSKLKRLRDRHLRRAYMRIVANKLGLRGKRAGMAKAGTLDWVSPLFLEPLHNLAERKVPTLIVYGTEDPIWAEWQEAAAGRLGRIVAKAGPAFHVRADVPGVIHGLSSRDVQEGFFAAVLDWFRENGATITAR